MQRTYILQQINLNSIHVNTLLSLCQTRSNQFGRQSGFLSIFFYTCNNLIKRHPFQTIQLTKVARLYPKLYTHTFVDYFAQLWLNLEQFICDYMPSDQIVYNLFLYHSSLLVPLCWCFLSLGRRNFCVFFSSFLYTLYWCIGLGCELLFPTQRIERTESDSDNNTAQPSSPFSG